MLGYSSDVKIPPEVMVVIKTSAVISKQWTSIFETITFTFTFGTATTA